MKFGLNKMTLKPNLVFNWVCSKGLLCIILNGKFCSLLVRILIQKDNTDNKVLESNFIQKKQDRKG